MFNRTLALRRTLTPLGDRLLIRRAEKEVKTASGILLPSDKAKDANEGTVVAVGPGLRDVNGTLHPPSMKAGDNVLLPKYGGTEVEIGEEKLFLFREEDILGTTNRSEQMNTPSCSPAQLFSTLDRALPLEPVHMQPSIVTQSLMYKTMEVYHTVRQN
ncbi:hypothetical protein ACHAWO_011931 [Cyclotella atomus]|uniref:Chaperonin 10 n=1 Tax=Cyclotella atomus TaxID=382360 RepID=A0ABD3PBK7_9STRA